MTSSYFQSVETYQYWDGISKHSWHLSLAQNLTRKCVTLSGEEGCVQKRTISVPRVANDIISECARRRRRVEAVEDAI